MSIIKIEDIIAYTDGENIFHPDSIQATKGLEPILRDQVPEDVVLVCDISGIIIT